MKAEDVVSQLKAVLPTATNLFSDQISITSLTRSGTTVTAITSTDHGLSTGNQILIDGALTPVNISSLTFANGIATAITASNHDLTEGWENGKPSSNPQIEITGADQSEYNGLNPLSSVLTRTRFKYEVTGTPATPATGSPQLLERFNSGYNGIKTITVINNTTFTYEITETPLSPAQGTIILNKSTRVARSVNIERAEEAYTKKETQELWAIVVLGDVTPSKDRQVESDATNSSGAGTEYRIRNLTPFSVFVFIPTTQEISGAAARDLVESDIRPALYKSLLRVKFDSGLSTETRYGIIAEGDAFYDYNGAYYIHQFIFSDQTDVIYDDTVDPDFNVSFKDMQLDYLDDFEVIELTTNVDVLEIDEITVASKAWIETFVFTDRTIQFASDTSNTQIFVGDNDKIYLGNDIKFEGIVFDPVTVSSDDILAVFEYWNGSAWASLSVTDQTLGFTVGGQILFAPPGDWSTSEISSTGEKYYVRITRTKDVITTIPIEKTIKIKISN